jgi:hypothetical protein
LHITLAKARSIDPASDDLNRSQVGFDDRMTDEELYKANHGCWKLGSRARSERYYLASFDGLVRQAVQIDRIERSSPHGSRSVIHGRVLQSGHPVFEKWVGKPSPVTGVRNPITYFDDEADSGICLCGCRERTMGSDFAPGHDQRALHDRVRQIGTVAQFIHWFDVVRHEGLPTSDGRPSGEG